MFFFLNSTIYIKKKNIYNHSKTVFSFNKNRYYNINKYGISVSLLNK